jgi:hypothetical protein
MNRIAVPPSGFDFRARLPGGPDTGLDSAFLIDASNAGQPDRQVQRLLLKFFY